MKTLFSNAASGGHSHALRDAINYWEARRLPYNLVLAGILVLWLAFATGLGPVTRQDLLALVVLAVLANVCYSAAYLVDLSFGSSPWRKGWRRWGRLSLWIAGTLFALVLENYWIADEIYAGIA